MLNWAAIHKEMRERTEMLQQSLAAQPFLRDRDDHTTFNMSDEEWSLTFNIWAKRLPVPKIESLAP